METNFIFSKVDADKLLIYILANDFILVPDKFYKTAQYIEIETLSELQKNYPENGRFYLLHDKFSKEELQLNTTDNPRCYGFFYIMQHYGGPVLDLAFMNYDEVFQKKENPSFGNFSCNAYYFKNISNIKTKPDQTYFDMYSDISKYIKKLSFKVKLFKRPCYIGFEARKKIIDGYNVPALSKEQMDSLRQDLLSFCE